MSKIDTIILDGRMQSEMDWSKERTLALKSIEKGNSIMWHMEMGLFSGLSKALANQPQFLALGLALDYFRDSFWKDVLLGSIGLSLYRGPSDFSVQFPWDSEQEQNYQTWVADRVEACQSVESSFLRSLYCRDVCVRYITLLASRLPDNLPVFLHLDGAQNGISLTKEIQLLHPELFKGVQLILSNHHLPWGSSSSQGEVSVGVCIPPQSCYHLKYYEGLEEAIRELQRGSISFKLIPEANLTAEWDGLDFLFYSGSGISPEGKRKLLGFCAAGGTPIGTSKLLGLPGEISFQDWLSKQE